MFRKGKDAVHMWLGLSKDTEALPGAGAERHRGLWTGKRILRRTTAHCRSGYPGHEEDCADLEALSASWLQLDQVCTYEWVSLMAGWKENCIACGLWF